MLRSVVVAWRIWWEAFICIGLGKSCHAEKIMSWTAKC